VGEALNEVVDDEVAGDVDALLLAEGPKPPELDAATANVYEVEAVSPGIVHDVPGEGTVQVREPGLAVTV
jgi:hypothetical protein